MEYCIYTMLGLLIANTSIVMQMAIGRINDKRRREEEEAIEYKTYTCSNCHNSIDMNTQTPVEYCPFCGEKYEGVEK